MGRGTAGDHKGPPSRSPLPSPLRTGELISQKPTQERETEPIREPKSPWKDGEPYFDNYSSDNVRVHSHKKTKMCDNEPEEAQ